MNDPLLGERRKRLSSAVARRIVIVVVTIAVTIWRREMPTAGIWPGIVVEEWILYPALMKLLVGVGVTFLAFDAWFSLKKEAQPAITMAADGVGILLIVLQTFFGPVVEGGGG